MELRAKSFDDPDERPTLPKSHADIVRLGDVLLVRGHLDAGWRWSNDWQPIFKTSSCQMPHMGVVLSGQFHFEMDDGTSLDLKPGDAYTIPPGHDAWVAGDQPVKTIDWVIAHDAATESAIEAGTKPA